MDSNQLKYEAEGGEKDSSSWRYNLTIKPNGVFNLKFHLRSWMGDSNWSDASVDDWNYDGNYTATIDKGEFLLTFSNIYKTGESQANGDWSGSKPIPRELYTKGMKAKIKTDGSCEFTKDKWGVFMKGTNDTENFFKNNCKVEVPVDPIIFEASAEYQNDSWWKQLTLKADSTYALLLNTRDWNTCGWSDAAVTGEQFEGNYTVTLQDGCYVLYLSKDLNTNSYQNASDYKVHASSSVASKKLLKVDVKIDGSSCRVSEDGNYGYELFLKEHGGILYFLKAIKAKSESL